MQLFTPLAVGPVTLANRIVLPAMVTRLSGEDGLVNQDIEERYVRFARGEPGLIVVEAMGISQSKSGPLLRIGHDDFLPGLRRLACRIHDTAPVKVVPQIIHFLKISRSGWRQTIHDLSAAEIHAIVREFGAAAGRAREAGFDGVELHMAHAYTLSSFLSRMNHRKDEFGGSLENRLRVPTLVLSEVRRVVGADFLIGARFDGEECVKDGYSLPDAQKIALRLAHGGIHYISISAGGKFEDAIKKPGVPLYPYTGYSGDRCMPGKSYPDSCNLYLAQGVKQALVAHGHPQVRVVGTGKIWRPEQAEDIVQTKTDLVGMARQLLADPDWPRKLRDGRAHTIVYCEYGNVCKALDENFQRVRCTLWPKDEGHAPLSRKSDAALPPLWPEGGPQLQAQTERGRVRLTWARAVDPEAAAPGGSPDGAGGIYGYELFRAAVEVGQAGALSAPVELLHHASVRATTPNFLDLEVQSGLRYTYAVQAYDRRGVRGPRSAALTVELPPPAPAPAAP